MCICFAISRTLCSVAVSGVMLPAVPELSGRKRKTGMKRSGPTSSAFRRGGWRLALQEWHRRSTCCAANALYASRRANFGPQAGWRRRRRGAQLDWELAFYASCRRLRARPGGGRGESPLPVRPKGVPARVALCLANGEAGQKTNVKPKLPAGPQEPRRSGIGADPAPPLGTRRARGYCDTRSWCRAVCIG